jgi:hypothetical protein
VRLKVRIGVVVTLAVIVTVLAVMVVVHRGSRSVTVDEVLAQPKAYKGRIVHVEGTADRVSPRVVGYRVFRLTDGASSVWVLSKLGAPADGSRIVVHGRVMTGPQLGVPMLGSIALGTCLVEEDRTEP